MSAKDSVTVIIYDSDSDEPSKSMLPNSDRLRARVVELKKHVLAQSICALITDLHEVVGQLPASSGTSELETISVGIQVSAQGGAALVLTAGAEVANTMTLTFRLKKEHIDGSQQ